MKEKERNWKKLKVVEMPKIWEEDPQAAETYREKERVKKHKQ